MKVEEQNNGDMYHQNLIQLSMHYVVQEYFLNIFNPPIKDQASPLANIVLHSPSSNHTFYIIREFSSSHST